jgi:hypothetical protein
MSGSLWWALLYARFSRSCSLQQVIKHQTAAVQQSTEGMLLLCEQRCTDVVGFAVCALYLRVLREPLPHHKAHSVPQGHR